MEKQAIKKPQSVIKKTIKLWRFLGKKRQLQFFSLFLLMMIAVFAEIISIGAVVPFLNALTSPEVLFQISWLQPWLKVFKIHSPDQLLLPMTIAFVSAAVFASIVRIMLLWFNTRLTANMGVQLRKAIYTRTLYQPYEYHVSNNSSQIISLVTEKVGAAIVSGILHILLLMSALIMSLAVISTLILINPIVALLAGLILGGGYMLFGFLARKRIKINGRVIAENQPDAVKSMQEGLGGIRDIIMDNSQPIFSELYTKCARNIQYAQTQNLFLGGLPKAILEMLGILLIAVFAYWLQMREVGQQETLPILGALALGGQRLLPSLQQVYFSWTVISANQQALADVLSVLDLPSSNDVGVARIKEPFKFNDKIELKNICFSYQGSKKQILNNVSFVIEKGSRIGLTGETGSGKSTLLDIVMGLLSPSQGYIKVDNIQLDETNIGRWQQVIAHVPQNIYLSDGSMAENIAFGVSVDEIDINKVKKAAQQAQIHDFIETLPLGYQTLVGERGIRLSGGQRQRIGIARALYKEAKLIVFDEATSALDTETEENVMDAIESLKNTITIIIIAHRLSTLSCCENIFHIHKGIIKETVSDF